MNITKTMMATIIALVIASQALMTSLPVQSQSLMTTPQAITLGLVRDHGINYIEGAVQCAVVFNEYINKYLQCLEDGKKPKGCEKIAVRRIAGYACKSYCSCQ